MEDLPCSHERSHITDFPTEPESSACLSFAAPFGYTAAKRRYYSDLAFKNRMIDTISIPFRLILPEVPQIRLPISSKRSPKQQTLK